MSAERDLKIAEAVRSACANAARWHGHHEGAMKVDLAVILAAIPPDTTSHDSMQLAQMVMSDCGVSCAATDRLQTRVAERIQRHIDGLQPEPVGVPEGWRQTISDAIEILRCDADAAVNEGATDIFDVKDDMANRLTALLAAAQQPVLDKPARVGGVNFLTGVSTAHVIHHAQRHYEWWQEQRESEQPVHDFAALIHYPEHWDTAAYPTLDSAIAEVLGCVGCSECKAEQPEQADEDAEDVIAGIISDHAYHDVEAGEAKLDKWQMRDAAKEIIARLKIKPEGGA